LLLLNVIVNSHVLILLSLVAIFWCGALLVAFFLQQSNNLSKWPVCVALLQCMESYRVIRCVATNGHFVFAFVASRQKVPPPKTKQYMRCAAAAARAHPHWLLTIVRFNILFRYSCKWMNLSFLTCVRATFFEIY